MTKTTLVTGLWNIGRSELTEGFRRQIDEYVEHLNQLIRETDAFIYLYLDPSLSHLVPYNERLFIVPRSIEELRSNFDFTKWIDEIRVNPNWYNNAEWLPNSPQAALKDYNIVTMSKYFLLNDASISNPFKTKYFYWLDAGIARTLPLHYVKIDVLDKIPDVYDVRNKLLFLSYPYTGNTEVHGFLRSGMNKFSNVDYTTYVCRGGFFGGSSEIIQKYNSVYYVTLYNTLKEGYMGTEESIFTILSHLYYNDIVRHDVGESGLIYNFFEYVTSSRITNNTALYVLTFNSPSQFQMLHKTFTENNFITNTKKFLINNSNDISTFEEYDKLCYEFDYEQIKFDNIGINGARQFIADHFDKSLYDYYIFFEDDMQISSTVGVCKSGFGTYVWDLYRNSLDIMKKEGLDYLKLSFSEFFGDNATQFAWYNIPQEIREREFPDNSKLPYSGLSPNPPSTKFDSIKIHNNIPYALGQVYYCNWPLWFNKEGNSKIFLEEVFDHPYEQTWMSKSFSLHLDNRLKTGVLLASPINHNRFDHYTAERKEN